MDTLENLIKRFLVTMMACFITAIGLQYIKLDNVKVSEKTILIITYVYAQFAGFLYRLGRNTPNCVRSITFLSLGATFYWKLVNKISMIGFKVDDFDIFSFSVYTIFFTASAIESIWMDYKNQANQAHGQNGFEELDPIPN